MHYHIWFVTKYHKTILAGDIEKRVKDVFLEVEKNKKYTILEVETNKDHAHLLVEAGDRKNLAEMVRTLKCVSAKKVLEELRSTPCLSLDFTRDPSRNPERSEGRTGNVRNFWARGYGHKIVYEPQIEKVKDYIRNQKRIPHT